MADDRKENNGLFGAIRGILEALSEAEHDGTSDFGDSGRYSSGHFTTEYGFSGSIGGARPGADTDSGSGTGSQSAPSSSSDASYRVDVRYDDDDDELLVVADLPDVDVEDLSVGLDEEHNELVIGVGNRAVERLELPWRVADADAAFRHGILELRFTPDGEGGER